LKEREETTAGGGKTADKGGKKRNAFFLTRIKRGKLRGG